MDINATFYNCTRGTFHSDECDGSCGEYTLTETDIELIYENKRWELASMSFQGVPSVLKGGPFSGVIVDPMEILLRIQALVELLVEKEIISDSDYKDALTKYALKRMTVLRENAEKEHAKQRLAVARTPLLGPNGQPMN